MSAYSNEVTATAGTAVIIIDDKTQEIGAVSCYPNPPVKNGPMIISYAIGAPGSIVLEIYDLRGNMVLSRTEQSAGSGSNQLQLDTIKLAPGLYYFALKYEGSKTAKSPMKSFLIVK